MKIPDVDRSKYLRGLLIVARMDKQISESDNKIITNTAKHLGFSSDFYDEVLNTLLFNEYICNDPVSFETSYLAKHFLTDAIKLAGTNKNSHFNFAIIFTGNFLYCRRNDVAWTAPFSPKSNNHRLAA